MLIGLFNDSSMLKIINNWDSRFKIYSEAEKKELRKFLLERLKTLKENIFGIIDILYERGQAYIVDIDTALENERIELGGGSVGINNIVDNLEELGIVGKDYPYRLTRRHRNAIDQIYLKNLLS